MKDEVLSGVFENYVQSQSQVKDVSAQVDTVIKAFLDSEFGSNLENVDGFGAQPSNWEVSTIRMIEPDEYGSTSEIVIEIMAEGRARLEAAYWADDAKQDSAVKILHFHSQETPSQIAGRVASAMATFSNNEISNQFDSFAKSAVAELNEAPGANR